MNENVISIDYGRSDQTFVGGSRTRTNQGAAGSALPAVLTDVPEPPHSCVPGARLSFQELYPAPDTDSRLYKALNLIERARECLAGSLEFDPSVDFFQFDQEIMKARAIFLRAFMYRDIGEGYAALVNAVIWALANRKPGSPSRRQINVIAKAMERLINGPFMHFDTSMQIMDELEGADLDIEPPTLDILTEEFDG